MASTVIRALQLSTWLPSNTQTMKWPGFWWANIILFKLYMALSHDDFNHPQLAEPIGLRAWHPIKSVMHTGLKHMHSHYDPGGFPRMCAASAFPPSPKRGTWLYAGFHGKRSIAIFHWLSVLSREVGGYINGLVQNCSNSSGSVME